jgi:hypothetical protein
MADPVTILISLAPFILDLLFGEGHSRASERSEHSMKHRKINPSNIKMDKALLMSGGAYPRRKDYESDKEFYDVYAKEYAKYAVKSTANPWVLYLEKSGFYDRMREEIDRLRDKYNQLKIDSGIPIVTKEKHYTKPLSVKKEKQIAKYKAVKDILEQIRSNEPSPIKDEFKKLVKKEYEKALKMGFSDEDIKELLERIFSRLIRTIESAEKDLEKYKSKAEPQTQPPPQSEVLLASGYARPSYKLLAKELARKYGFRLPRSARQHGKTWKEIYMDLTTGLK